MTNSHIYIIKFLSVILDSDVGGFPEVTLTIFLTSLQSEGLSLRSTNAEVQCTSY